LFTISEWSLTHYPLHWPFRKAMGGVFLLLPLGYLGLLNLDLAHLYLAHQAGYPWRVAAHHLAQTLAPPDLIICHHLPHRWTNSPAHSPDECITEVGQRLAEAAAPTLPLQRLENVVTLETGLQFRERASQAGVVWVVLWGAALPPLEQKVNSVPDQTEKLSLLVFNRQPSLVANLERAIASLAQMDTLSPDRFTYDLYRAKLLAYQGQPGQAEHLLRTAAAHSLPAVALAETKNTLRTLAHFSKPGLIPTQPLAVNFGRPPLIGLRGYTLTGPAQAGQSLSLTLFWESRAATATDYTIFLHIRDEQQQIVSQLDIQPFAP
jgi:hypothetical protein